MNKAHFEVKTTMFVEQLPGSKIKLDDIILYLKLSKNLSRERYFDLNGLTKLPGVQAITNTLIQGLVGSIHNAHQTGVWDSADHLRYIIRELENGFISQVNVKSETLKG